MNEKEYNKGVFIDRAVHYIVMIATVVLMAFSLWFAYNSSQGQKQNIENEKREVQSNIKGNGHKKNLPDFIVDKIPSDKLEQLKP